MEGVILFADNNVFTANSFENKLFTKLSQEQTLTVLPICTLPDLEATIKTASTYKALVLDWNFNNSVHENDDDFEDLDLVGNTPENILDSLDIYSLIYVYSQNQIPQEIQDKYCQRFPNKIQFNIKNAANIDQECARIQHDIQLFCTTYPHMEIPYLWSQSINSSVQKIFNELESANSFWIKEIRDTAIADGSDATSEIIDMFNNLLNEDLIQNNKLRDILDNFNYNEDDTNEEKTARLYQRIYYSRLNENAPIMTGDIFKFSEEEFGILITPECELADQQKERARKFYDFLVINKTSSVNYQKTKQTSFNKNPNSAKEIFNNGVISRHVLISFPFADNVYNQIALIEFNTDFRTMPKIDSSNHHILECRTNYKLNAPYIHQLRQRFVSYFGKYGVPAIPNSLREYNLKQQE